MELWTTIKRDWHIIAVWITLILLVIIAFANINWEKPKFKEGYNWIWYSILCLIGIISFIVTYHFLKSPNIGNNNKFALEFLKVLLPTLLAILSLLYALSSGLFNIKSERLQKNKANLQYDINKLEKDKVGFQKEKEILGIEIKNTKSELDLLRNDIIIKEKEAESFKKSFEEIKKESQEKSKAINDLQHLNYQFKLQSEKRAKNISQPIVELVEVFSSQEAGYLVSVYDTNLKQLTNEDIGLLSSFESPILAQYDEQTKKFKVKVAGYLYRIQQEDNRANKIFNLNIYRRKRKLTKTEKLNYNNDSGLGSGGLDHSDPWTIAVPYISAEYKIILNDF